MNQPHLSRALPQIYVDLLGNGLPEHQAKNPRKVWGALLSVAMSAYRRGWSQADYINEVCKDEWRSGKRHQNTLWTQMQACNRKPTKSLHSAWDTAVANVGDVGDRTRADLRADAIERAYEVVDRLTDGIDGLSEIDTAVLRFVAGETERRGFLTVACPAHAVAEYAKCAKLTAQRSLTRLAERGYLVKHSAGSGGRAANRRAAIYSLTPPGSHIHPVHTYGYRTAPVVFIPLIRRFRLLAENSERLAG